MNEPIQHPPLVTTLQAATEAFADIDAPSDFSPDPEAWTDEQWDELDEIDEATAAAYSENNAALKNRSITETTPTTDPAFMRLVKAMATDMAPVRDVLEQMLNADDDALDALMAEMTTKLPELSAQVFSGKAADAVLRDMAAVELLRGADL